MKTFDVNYNHSYCVVEKGKTTRSKGDAICEGLNARLPLPKSDFERMRFLMTFAHLQKKNYNQMNLYHIDLRLPLHGLYVDKTLWQTSDGKPIGNHFVKLKGYK